MIQDYNPWVYSPQSWLILQVENVKQIVALNVRLARQTLGISQEEFSERAGIDLTYESRIERGRANLSVEVMAKLAEALEVDVVTLLTFAQLRAGVTLRSGSDRRFRLGN